MNYDDWMKEIKAEQKAHDDFRETAKKVVERYQEEEDRGKNESRYNILWANTEVIHGAVYENPPQPDIRRRFLDRDPVGKQVSEMMERGVSYTLDAYDFDSTMDDVVDGYLVAGLGQARLRYVPYFEKGEAPKIQLSRLVKDQMEFDGEIELIYGVFDDEGKEVEEYEEDEYGPYMLGEPEEELVHEEVICEQVNWDCFGWEPSKRWEDVDWCYIKHYMDETELKENFDDITGIPLNYTDEGDKTEDRDKKARALIYEIFDKKNRKNITIADGYNKILEEEEDPLGLEDYFPFPKPLVATLKNGKFIPIPDYIFYQDQALELDTITTRINVLTSFLKIRGFTDGSFKELADIANQQDGTFLPIDNFSERFNGTQGDLRKAIATMPLEEIQSALVSLYRAREEIKQTIYEITGIADIMRGSTQSSETLGAQQLKTQFGSMRINKRRKKVDQFIRDIVRLKCEIMVENFQTETLEMMTGIEVTPDMERIFRNDLLRSYRIDIETDSTITEDAAKEKEQRIELVTAVTAFVEKVGPQVQAGIMPAQVAKELLGFAIRGFKVGRTLEDVIDEMGQNDQDPRMQEMQMKVRQFQQMIQQKAGEQIQAVQQDAGKQIKQLEGKLFDMQKQLAIEKERNQVKIASEQIKGEIQTKAQMDKNDLTQQLEMFKAQLAAIMQIPDQRSQEVQEMMSVIGQAFQRLQDETEAKFAQVYGDLQATNDNLSGFVEYMKKPARLITENGKVVGATRD